MDDQCSAVGDAKYRELEEGGTADEKRVRAWREAVAGASVRCLGHRSDIVPCFLGRHLTRAARSLALPGLRFHCHAPNTVVLYHPDRTLISAGCYCTAGTGGEPPPKSSNHPADRKRRPLRLSG